MSDTILTDRQHEINSRVESVDLMKGFAILLVVFGHAVGAVTSSKMLVEIPYSFTAIYDFIYSFHMPIFFFVAGLFIERWTQRSYKKALWGKFYRLAIPYFVWGGLFAIYKEVGGSFSNHSDEGIISFLWSPLIPWNIFWFLYVLLFIQVIYYIFINLSDSYKRGRRCFFLISLILFMVFPCLPDVWIIHRLCKFMIFFAIGTYMLKSMADFEKQMTFKLLAVIISIFCFISCIYLFVLNGENMLAIRSRVFLITGSVGILAIAAFSWLVIKFSKLCNFIRYCGEKSMEIYLLHPFILGALRVIFDKMFGFEYLWIKTTLLFTMAMLMCCWLWYKVDNDNRFYRFMFGIK